MTATLIARSPVPRLLDPDTAAAWWRLVQVVTDQPPPCARHPEMWFSVDADATEAAVRACTGCHAIDLCGTYAAAAGERHGVWAGVDRTRRRRRTVPTEVVVA